MTERPLPRLYNNFRGPEKSFKKNSELVCQRCGIAVMSQRLLKKYKGKAVCRNKDRCNNQRAMRDAE